MKKYYDKKRLDVRVKDRHRIHSEQFDAQQIANLLDVSVQTAYKYLSDQHEMDSAKLELLKIKGLGKIPFPGWDGFYFDQSGNLVGRNGYSMNPEEIANFTYIKQAHTLLQIENKKLKDRIEELENDVAFGNVVMFPAG